ncbi:MAG: acyl carrier protein [Myxococcota bacterium]|jgi:acyl carrier protein
MSDVTHKLIQLAAKRFDADPTVLTAADDFFEKLGIDSIQALDLLTDLEDAFDVEIPDYELQGIVTFQALATIIEKRR